MNTVRFISLALVCLLSVYSVYATESVNHDFQKETHLSNKQCISCHKQSQHDWNQSDHAKSMAIADKTTVLANFDNVKVEHYGQKAHFLVKGGFYQVTISYDDKITTYPIIYTFGHFPLQQYLVETEQGKLQVLPFAWDSRAKEEGGQRWYHNYSHEEIRPEDRLHWRQPLQNWNGMCADCHSDGLIRQYNPEMNGFNSQFDNINVGCLSCHGDMSEHANKSTNRNVVADTISNKHPTGKWLRSIGEKTAHWEGKKRDNRFMDGCFACHSLRTSLTDGITPKAAFLDQFTPQLLSSPNYHADGQIKEEVYVYGSFLQSKMFTAGVNCLDCHDKHTMKLKFEGNTTCLQCHGAETYNAKSHHQHEEMSEGAQCVNCHMPTNRYMGVDDRRDHSFKIPRPDLSIQFSTPNACTQCHIEKTNQWAVESLEEWHGKPNALSKNKQLLMALNNGQAINLEDHLSIIADEDLDVISRASALQMLSFTTPSLSGEVLKPYLTHQESLFRLSAVNVGALLSPTERKLHISPLLGDKFKSIRVAAARTLASSYDSDDNSPDFDKAFNELIQANNINSWRGEGLANQGVLAIERNKLMDAEKSFKQSIKIDPYFEASYINLADLYRVQQKPFLVDAILKKGIKYNPKSADLHYAYALYYVRQKKLGKALVFLDKSMFLMPSNAQYAYTYILALDGAGLGKQALNKLKTIIINYQNNAQLKELGLYLSHKLNSRTEYDWFMKI